jgi:hypothetical protein
VGFEEAFRSVGLGLTRFLAFAAHGFLFGLVPVILLVVRPSLTTLPAEWVTVRSRLARRMEEMMQAAITIAVLATGIALLLQTLLVAEASGQWESEAFGSVVDSGFGRWHLLRLPLLMGLVVLLARRVRTWSLSGTFEGETSPGRSFWAAWATMAAALVATISLAGHSASGERVALSLPNDLLHVAAGAIWFTGIVVLAVVLPARVQGALGWGAAPSARAGGRSLFHGGPRLDHGRRCDRDAQLPATRRPSTRPHRRALRERARTEDRDLPDDPRRGRSQSLRHPAPARGRHREKASELFQGPVPTHDRHRAAPRSCRAGDNGRSHEHGAHPGSRFGARRTDVYLCISRLSRTPPIAPINAARASPMIAASPVA